MSGMNITHLLFDTIKQHGYALWSNSYPWNKPISQLTLNTVSLNMLMIKSKAETGQRKRRWNDHAKNSRNIFQMACNLKINISFQSLMEQTIKSLACCGWK